MEGTFERTWTIGQACEEIGAPAGTVRQWLKDFSEHIEVPRDEAGQRFFTARHIATLRQIRTWRSEGISIAQIRERLASGQTALVESFGAPAAIPTQQVSEEIARLQRAVEALAAQVQTIVREEVRLEVAAATQGIESSLSQLAASVETVVTETRAERQAREAQDSRGFFARLFSGK